jgi:hypothetical protein
MNKYPFITLLLLFVSGFAIGQRTVFPNGVDVSNRLDVDSLKAANGIKSVHAQIDSARINNGLNTKNLTADEVKINNNLVANNVTATNFNFTNSLDLTGSQLRVGNMATVNNTDFILRYRNQAGVGAMFSFFKGDGNPSNTVRDATITKNAGQPLTLSTDAAESIVFSTAGVNRVTVGGNGNIGIGANPTAEKLNLDGNARITGNVGINASPTATEKLYVNGNTKIDGNVGIGTNPTSDRVAISGNIRLTGSEPTYRAVGAYPTLDLDGGTNTYPRIHFSGANKAGDPEVNFTTITGEGGGIRLKTSGDLVSELLNTQANVGTKQLHVYQAQNWAGYAAIEAKALYGGAAYANAIDLTLGTRLKIEQNQYTGGLLMGFSNTTFPVRSNLIAASIKSQYMGTEINTAGQNRFDMVFGIHSDGNGTFSFDPVERMRINDNGVVRIGRGLTINTNLPLTGDTRVLVDGRIVSTNVTVALVSNWPDYVFEKNYKLKPLAEVEQYINQNGHLPNVPSAAEVKKDGIDVATMNIKLMEKVEELTLYLINQQKQIDALKKEIKELKKK